MSNIVHSISDTLVDDPLSISSPQEMLQNLKKSLQGEYNKYSKYKLLFEGLKDCLDNDQLDETTKTKINIIKNSVDAGQTCNIDNTLILGLTLTPPELNHVESEKLESILKLELDLKHKKICEEYYEVTSENINQATNTQSDTVLMEFREQLTTEQELYINNLKEQQEILTEMANLRLEQLPKVVEQKQWECQVKSRLNQLKSAIAQQKVRVDIFMETPNSLEAYKILIKDIKDQQGQCRRDIENLQNLKEKYGQVSCKQFDDILKSFIQFKRSIEKKKLLFDTMQM